MRQIAQIHTCCEPPRYARQTARISAGRARSYWSGRRLIRKAGLPTERELSLHLSACRTKTACRASVGVRVGNVGFSAVVWGGSASREARWHLCGDRFRRDPFMRQAALCMADQPPPRTDLPQTGRGCAVLSRRQRGRRCLALRLRRGYSAVLLAREADRGNGIVPAVGNVGGLAVWGDRDRYRDIPDLDRDAGAAGREADRGHGAG